MSKLSRGGESLLSGVFGHSGPWFCATGPCDNPVCAITYSLCDNAELGSGHPASLLSLSSQLSASCGLSSLWTFFIIHSIPPLLPVGSDEDSHCQIVQPESGLCHRRENHQCFKHIPYGRDGAFDVYSHWTQWKPVVIQETQSGLP